LFWHPETPQDVLMILRPKLAKRPDSDLQPGDCQE
jgi:hypothetical protein